MTGGLILSPCCEPGRPWPMGVQVATLRGHSGLNIAVFAPNARAVVLCLFDATGQTETGRWRLPAQADGVWHGFVPGPGVGQLYGLRADGPWLPEAGHRFNPTQLLIDPWARAMVGPTDAAARSVGHRRDSPEEPDPHDNAGIVPKARVVDVEAELQAGAAIAPGPGTDWRDTFIYEAHVKSLTRLHPQVDEPLRGSYAALASPPMLAHYRELGVTALCLLPVHLRLDEKHLLDRGLTNHWGYNTLSYFIPDPRFATLNGDEVDAAAVRTEFRRMVDTLHRHGIEVILDVVYNHTAESDALGPTLSWRGLDNASWYAMEAHGQYFNPTGCGNTFNMGQPRVVQLIMDSLRWWVQAFGVDGFRVDLAVALGRSPELGRNFNHIGVLFSAIAQDPVLAPVKLIAEPWDLGPHGYRVGQFGPRWCEWNDHFRDVSRAWWLGHACTRGQFARRLAASSDLYQASGRQPATSVNMVTAHDGFNLADLTAYLHKNNEANGEYNQDGHDHNLSANGGHEGLTSDTGVQRLRGQWRRALLATLLCAQGTPQLLAGDEIGHSQQGNNNAYCQDNTITWLDWENADTALAAFVAAAAGLRRHYPALRHPHWFTGECQAGSPWPDIEWRKAEGTHPTGNEWEIPDGHLLACVITVGEGGQPPSERVMLVFHGGDTTKNVTLPDGAWSPVLDSTQAWVARESDSPQWVHGERLVEPHTLLMLVQPLPPEQPSS